MGGHAALGYLVHPFAADLYFDPTARIGDDRRMQRFVSVRLRNRYPIAHTVRIGRIEIGHDRVDTPALRLLLFPRAIDDDPDREQVVHLVEADAHPLHLAPDRVDRLGAALQVIPDALRPHLLLDRPDEASDELLALGGRLGDPFLDIGVIGRLEVLQRDVLQFRLDIVQSQLMSDLRIKVQALPRLFLPLLLGKYVEDTHHLEPVGQLDQNDPGIGRVRGRSTRGNCRSGRWPPSGRRPICCTTPAECRRTARRSDCRSCRRPSAAAARHRAAASRSSSCVPARPPGSRSSPY